MEYPYGHKHHHDHRRDGGGEEYPPPAFDPHRPPPSDFDPHRPPPPSFDPHRPPPPSFDPHRPPSHYRENELPQVTHVYHSSHVGGERNPPPPYPPPPISSDHYAPPPPSQHFNYSDSHTYAPPPPTVVQHVSHESETNPHHYQPHMPSFVHHHSQHQGSGLADHKPTVRVFSKAETNYSLTIRNGKVIVAPSDPSDPFQHWIKDQKYSTRVKDEEGFPSFALINKATGQAMKHSIGATHPVQLIPYNPDVLDESILWTESKDLGDSYRTIRMVNNIRLNVDVLHGDKNHGGVHDGSTIVLWEWKKGENQRWKISPY